MGERKASLGYAHSTQQSLVRVSLGLGPQWVEPSLEQLKFWFHPGMHGNIPGGSEVKFRLAWATVWEPFSKGKPILEGKPKDTPVI